MTRCLHGLSRYAGWIAAALLGGTAEGQNVLMVVADDLGIDALRGYAHVTGVDPAGLPATPTLDALAADGVMFRNVWSNPVCSPTRASFQTGRYAFRCGVGTAIPVAPELGLDQRTLPERAAAAGLRVSTGLIGKWHLGGDPLDLLGRWRPNLQGYDHFSGTLQSSFTGGASYESWLKVTDGSLSVSNGYATTVAVDDALAWLAGRRESWFLQVHFHAPHTPFHAPPAHLHSTTLPAVAPCDDPAPFVRAAIEALDTEFGRLLAGIEPKVLARTMVVFVSDNGSASQVIPPPLDPAHAKGTLFEGGLRVPLIVSGAGVSAPGTESAALVSVLDLHDTVLDWFGLPRPVDSDGVGLLPYLEDPGLPSLRDHLFAEHFHPPGPPPTFGDGTPCTFSGDLQFGVAARSATHKLIRLAGQPDRLFDLVHDPGEAVDMLAGPPLGGPELAQLQALEGLLSDLVP